MAGRPGLDVSPPTLEWLTDLTEILRADADREDDESPEEDEIDDAIRGM